MPFVWEPSQEAIEETNVWRFMQRLRFDNRLDFLNFSVEHPEAFWGELEKAIGVEWFAPYSRVIDYSNGPEWTKWFTGGRLNVAHNCLDRYAGSNRLACIWQNEDGERREITFSDLARRANQLARYLAGVGIQIGDRVALCAPMDPEILTVIYGCLKIGAVPVPIFSGFGPAAIASRLQDSGARLVFTARTLRRRGKELPLRAKVEEALESSNSVKAIVELREISKLIGGQPETPLTIEMASSDLALLLYTSGTTGQPKGCVHTHAGALLQTAKEIYLAFDRKPFDRFFWLSDIGWMMGVWAIFGNHHFGGTIFMYDGAVDYPRPDRLWQILDQEQITTFGVSPTAIRMLMRGSHPEDYAGDALRLLGSTGEPWDETSWMWFFKHVGKERCPIINISGGTEILGCFLFPLPIQPLKPCTLGGPAPGMATEVVDEAGRPVRGKKGYLVCTRPSPSMTTGIWGDPARYLETYWSRFPGWWYHGDWASVDDDGYWFLHGRADESMNVSGRKVGPAELEEILCMHPAVSEAAVIGVPDELKGEEIVAFIVLKRAGTSERISPNVFTEHLIKQMGAAFRPKRVHIVAEVPKTQSGKIVRRLIRERYLGRDLGDVSSLADASVLDAFANLAAEAP